MCSEIDGRGEATGSGVVGGICLMDWDYWGRAKAREGEGEGVGLI